MAISIPLNRTLIGAILGHSIIWILTFLALSPKPFGMGLVRIELLDGLPMTILLAYNLVLNAIIIYSYKFWALPVYLKEARVEKFLRINLAYWLGAALFKSLFDLGFCYVVLEVLTDQQPIMGLAGWLAVNAFTCLLVMLIANAYGFLGEWIKGQRLNTRLESEKLKTELLALKHQINPHFLFNSLNGLYALALKNEDDPTAEGISKLSQMMRYVLYESNEQYVNLAKEVAYIENYLALQDLRTSQLTQIDFRVSGPIKDKKIAPLILIPFIENAFKHGLSTVHPSHIKIQLRLEGSFFLFYAENPIHPNQKMKPPQKASGIGLDNVKRRLELLYPNAYQLEIARTDTMYRISLQITLI